MLITSGNVKDLEQYRAVVGEIQGLSFAVEELQSLLKGLTMTQRLIVPDYVVAQKQAKKQAEDKSAKERVPNPRAGVFL